MYIVRRLCVEIKQIHIFLNINAVLFSFWDAEKFSLHAYFIEAKMQTLFKIIKKFYRVGDIGTTRLAISRSES